MNDVLEARTIAQTLCAAELRAYTAPLAFALRWFSAVPTSLVQDAAVPLYRVSEALAALDAALMAPLDIFHAPHEPVYLGVERRRSCVLAYAALLIATRGAPLVDETYTALRRAEQQLGEAP